MGNQILKLRKQQKITQEELAIVAGVSRNHISKIENGKATGSVKVLTKISKKLGVSIEDIFLN